MNSQSKGKKGGWGSLLSGAVSGIESRLDNLLAEENALAAQKAADSAKSNGVSRTPSTRRAQANAIPKRSQTPQPAPPKVATSRLSIESTASDSAVASARAQTATSQELGARRSADLPDVDSGPAVRRLNSYFDTSAVSTEASFVGNVQVEEPAGSVKSSLELQSELQQARSDYENVEARRQDEVHDYLERIDSLQSKLQYLAKEASEAARKAITDSEDDTSAKKIAEKEEKIALLLEEGSKLSKTEVTQLGIIRNLRAEKAEQANSIADLKRKLALQEGIGRDRAFEVLRLEGEKKEALGKAAVVPSLEAELACSKTALTDKDERIRKLERDVQEANARADDEEKHRNAEALDIERATSSSLRDEVTMLKNDLTANRDHAKLEQTRMEGELTVANERHQATETALRNELLTLESRLEVLRAKTEETNASGPSGSATKLMRQVEVLQRQYSVASENWQGIEVSLQSRIAALEKERDESTKHENNARRKARELGSSNRKLQDQLDDAAQRIRVFEHEATEHDVNVESIQKKANDFEKLLQDARDKFEREKESLNASFNTRLEEERVKWQAPLHNTEPSIFSSSPHLGQPRKSSNLDLPGLSARRSDRRSTPNLTLSSMYRDPHSRRGSALPPTRGSETIGSPSNDSGPPTPFFGHAGNVLPTPSLHTTDHDLENDFENRSSPHRTINEMVSASTAAAGPSVQLVERISANVRRLETEKAANKEELARLAGQRDEARKEIVSLMQEVEVKREVDKKAEGLQKELADVQRRYAASLEMLGEKEEKVEELQADVSDLKKIYKELVERTIK